MNVRDWAITLLCAVLIFWLVVFVIAPEINHPN